MNFLSHHHVARLVAGNDDASPAFFLGNVLPDLMPRPTAPGTGRRLRARHVAGKAAPPPTPLVHGVRLHLASDRAFHGSPVFQAATSEAGRLLADTAFVRPLRRVFFLAHIFVELALDAALVRTEDPGVADHLYDQFDRADLAELAKEVEALLGHPTPGLPDALERFARARFLFEYQSDLGLAQSLARIAARAGVLSPEPLNGSRQTHRDAARLAALFADFVPRAACEFGPHLWQPPASTVPEPEW